MSEKKNTSFTQASLLAREEKVLQDAEIVITTQRNRIGELRSELERLNAEKVYWSNTHMKEMSDVIQENTKLRLQLDEMQSDLNALRHTQDSTDNLITNLTEALGAAESQLLSQDNELKKLRNLAGNLPRENNELREENQRLLAENEKLKRSQEENRIYLETNKLSKNGLPESDNNAIQAVNDSLKKHAKLARDLDFKTEELRVNKMCLLQLESDLLEHQLLVEQQRVEIQRLNTAVEALNREKALIPPVVITSHNFESQNNNGDLSNGVTPKEISEQIIAEITKIIPKLGSNKLGKENELGVNDGIDNEIDIAQYRTMEEQRILISKLLKGLDQLGFTRSEATCYKERASDYRWFYSAVISHSVTYNTKNPELTENGDTSNNTISPPGFFNLFVRVESGNLSIFQNIDEEVPMFSIKPWKSSIEIFEKHKQFVITRVSTTSDQIENHIFYCQTEDEFNRWFYALCYGGFVKSQGYVNNAINNGFINSNNNNGIFRNGNNYVATIKIYDVNNTSNYQLTHVSINTDKLVFNNDIGTIYTINSKLKIDLKKEDIIIDYISNNGLNRTVTFSSDNSSEFIELKDTLMKCNWTESKIITSDNSNTKNNKFSDYTVNISSSNKSNITSKLKLGKELIPQSINFSVNHNNDNNNVRHGIIMVENNKVLLYHDESDINPFTKIDIDDANVEFDRRKMSILLMKTKNNNMESFYYMFASLEEFNRSLARLREGGIKDYNHTEKRPTTKQICVVCKNKMYFYKDFEDSLNSVSFLTLSPDDTNCHIDSDRNEIILIYSQNETTKKKIILDCANMDEFTRWNIALSFGGFTEGVKRSSMSKYTFDISLFEVKKENGKEELINVETNENKSIYKDFYNITDCQSIEIYKTEESKKLNKPLMVIPFKDTEYIGDARKRQIIFLTRRGKAGEVRIIFNLQTLSNFDIMNKDLINIDFPVLESQNAATSSKAEYIIGAKSGILCIYCTSKNKDSKDSSRLNGGIKHALNDNKYLNKGVGVSSYNNNNSHNHHNDSNTRRFPECGYIKYLVSDFICVSSRAGRSVALRRREDDYDALSVRCKSLTEYEKWERSMSIAGFINNDSTNVNNVNSYLPPITYLFHSLDYDFRKQPILPTLSKEKTIPNSSGMSNSDLNHSDYSSLDDVDNSIETNKVFNQKHLFPINKKLHSTSIHKQTPPSQLLLSPYTKNECDKYENNDCFWDNIKEIKHIDEDKNIDHFNNFMNNFNDENNYLDNNEVIIKSKNHVNFVEFNILEENSKYDNYYHNHNKKEDYESNDDNESEEKDCYNEEYDIKEQDEGEVNYDEYEDDEYEVDEYDDNEKEYDFNCDGEVEFSEYSYSNRSSNYGGEEYKYECHEEEEHENSETGKILNPDRDENNNKNNIIYNRNLVNDNKGNKMSKIKEKISQRKDKLRRILDRIRDRKFN